MEKKKVNLVEKESMGPKEETRLDSEDEINLLKARNKLWFLGDVFYVLSLSDKALESFADNSKEEKNEGIIQGLYNILDETGDDIDKVLDKEWSRPQI